MVEDPTTFLEVVGKEISTVEPATTVEVVVPHVVVETEVKMVEDSATLVINVQMGELTIQLSVVVDQATVEGSNQGHHDGGEATKVAPSDRQGASSSSFDDKEEELDLFSRFFWCSKSRDFIMEIVRPSSTSQGYTNARAHF